MWRTPMRIGIDARFYGSVGKGLGRYTQKLIENLEKIDSENPLGYKNGEYAFGFFYNTPDNTLPIFWGTNNGWCPIFKRYDKNYKRKNLEINERFL